MDKLPITFEGYKRLQEEVKHLKHVERPAIIQAISEARELGDLSENAEYHAAKEKQSFIEGRILELDDKVARAEVIDVKSLSCNTIKFGATVKLLDDDTEESVKYQIVGEYEADISNNKISLSAPIARALIGKAVGDTIEVNAARGIKYYEILEIHYV